ncbi:hypothetical protein GN958_ATG12593 [Phytophthora infestans]|uniref:Uncharacterized protein n=1 Tax=Phytophthora infestans TaxID=4787 RepID=A0A8S9UCI6_PHYIN|nr:hypothetical protein GN958_ATG12593 [Phytophthora infestans]
MIGFWSHLRAALAANGHSVGLDALDQLVLRILADNTSQAPLESAVVILPSPESLSAGQVREHSVFQAPVTQTRSKRSSSRTPLKPPPAKKQRTSKNAKAKPRVSFDPTGVDATIERDLEHLVMILEGQGKTLLRMAFPWKGYRVYSYSSRCIRRRKHLRFWMRFRLQFLLLALYPPTDNAAARRNAFFEEMGYYGMLTAFEDTVHDNLMWFGGRAAKHASGANDDSKSPAQEDLGVLFKRHRRRNDQVIANALDPFEVDSSGYRSIPELLETSQTIAPTRPKNLDFWTRPWLASLWTFQAATLRKRTGSATAAVARGKSFSLTFLSVTLLAAGKSVIAHNDRPFQPSEQGEDDSDFEENGEFTALKPSPPVKYQLQHLAYYLGLSSDKGNQEQEKGLSNDHDDEEDKGKAQADINEDADDQDDEKDDEEAAENPTSTDNEAAFDASDNPSKTSKPSSTSPDSQTPK